VKTGTIYILGVIFALLVISSKQNSERNSFGADSFHSIGLNSNSDCLISEANIFFENSLQKLTSYRIEILGFTATISKIKQNIISAFWVSFQKKNVGIKHFNKIPFRLILYFSSDNSDSHNLV
jgi:hypothetical protein